MKNTPWRLNRSSSSALLKTPANTPNLNQPQQRIRTATCIAVLTGALFAGHAQAATYVWNGAGTTALWTTGSNWGGGTAPVSGSTAALQFDGTNNVVTNNDFTTGSEFLSINFNNGSGAYTLNGNTITLDGGINSNSTGKYQQVVNLGVILGSGTHTFSATAGNLVVNGAISEGAAAQSLIITGTSNKTVVLTGNNTFTGGVTIGNSTSGGALSVANVGNSTSLSSNLGTGAGAVTLGSGANTGTLIYTGTGESTDRTFNLGGTTGGGAIQTDGTGTLTLTHSIAATGAGSKTLSLQGIGTGVLTGAIGQNGTTALTKNGAGTWTVQSSNSISGAITVNNGNLVFDASNAAAGANNNYALTGTTNAINAAGGTIEFKAKTGSGNTTTQTVGTLTQLGNSGLTTLVANKNGGDGITVNLGGIVHNGGGFTLFDQSSGGVFTTSQGTLNSLVGGTATTGGSLLVLDSTGRVDFASKSGSNIIALNATSTLPASSGNVATNYALAGSQTLTAATNANTIRITTTGTGQSLNIGSNFLTVTSAGLLFTGTNDYSIVGSGTIGHSSTLGNNPSVFLENFGTGKLTVSAVLGAGGGSVTFVGKNTLTDWNSVSNVTGQTGIVSQVVRQSYSGAGAINLTNTNAGAGTGNIWVASGGILELSAADLTRNTGTTGNGTINMVGNAGFSAYGSDRIVNLNSGGTLTWGSTAGFMQNGATLLLGSDYSNHTVDFQNSVDLGSTSRVVQVNNGVSSSDVDAKMSGVITGTGGGLIKNGAGTLQLTAANTYTGATSLTAGKTILSGTLANTSSVSVSAGAELNLSGGRVNSAAVVDVSGKLTGAGTAGSVKVESGAQLVATGAISVSTLTLMGNSILDVKLNSTSGIAGTDWSQIVVTGALDLTNATAGSAITLKLDTGGLALSGWNPNSNYAWNDFVTFSSLSGGSFNANSFVIDVTGFTGTINGTFSVVSDGNSLDLMYAVPEPGIGGAMLAGGGLLAFYWRLRRRTSGAVE